MVDKAEMIETLSRELTNNVHALAKENHYSWGTKSPHSPTKIKRDILTLRGYLLELSKKVDSYVTEDRI